MEETTITTDEKIDAKDEIDNGMVHFTTTSEYISSAYNALAAIEDADTTLMSKEDEKRVKRIKRKCLKIIDICISEMYDELFENDDEE
jgi:hypothetical protein